MIKENLEEIFKNIENGNNFKEPISLVGATKTVDVSIINEAINLGLKIVAENKVQEFREKTNLIKGASQHFIGHLQQNKVKYLVGNVDIIQSVDTIELAQLINKIALQKKLIQNILLEINIGNEESKSGFSTEQIISSAKFINKLSNVKILGLMAMLPKAISDDSKKELCLKCREIFDILKKEGLSMKYLSLGMSDDYLIAIENGSNMIRLGSKIFGKRNYGETNGIV